MPDADLRARIKEMLVKNLMLQTTPDQIGVGAVNPTAINPTQTIAISSVAMRN